MRKYLVFLWTHKYNQTSIQKISC